MEIIKFATEWAKSEVFSSKFFILAGVLFLLSSYGFWQLGKSEVAKAYIVPTIVAGALILTVGIGIFIANKSRTTSFVKDYEANKIEFVEAEISRTQQSMKEYKNVVFKAIPFIIIACSLLIVFVDKPGWRASCITIIAMMTVILLVDSNADARIRAYHDQLKSVDIEQLK